MAERRFVNTPFKEEVGYTLKVVNGPRYDLSQSPTVHGNAIPFASVSGYGSSAQPTVGTPAVAPATASGCYQVRTPQGNVLLKAYTPGYYNPPLAYDRCSVPRPFGPQPTGAGGCKCGCGCQGSCGCGCGAAPSKAAAPPPPGPPPPPKPASKCGCPKCKAVMMGYAGESTEPLGPYYRKQKYQAGYFNPQYVNGPPTIGGTIGQVARKPSVRPSQAIVEKKVSRELLRGNVDELLDYLLKEGKAGRELSQAAVKAGATTGAHGKICMKQPCYEQPTQYTHLRSEPRSFDLQLSSPVICPTCNGPATTGGCGCGANLNAPVQHYYSCIERAFDQSRPVCPRQFQGYWNPWGQVNGPPTVGQTFRLDKQPVEKLADLIVVSTGFNPDKNPKLKKIVEEKLKESLAKENIRVVNGQVVGGPGTTGFLKDLVRGLGNAVQDVTKFVRNDVVNPMQQFVVQNAGQVQQDLLNVDKQLGITRSLQQFSQAGGLQGLSRQLGQQVQWPQMAALGFGLAGPAVGLEGINPVLGALGGKVGGGMGAVANEMQGLLTGQNPLGRALQQRGIGPGAGLQGLLTPNLPAAGGFGHLGALLGRKQQADPVRQLMGGQQGLLQLLGKQGQVEPRNMFSGLQGLGRQVVQPRGQGLNFNALAGLLR